ncbi:L,D-transpeptidase family protein [Microbacterium album]|uniref:Peptidoglycan-binding protein n=1 Tax=Microbacterium album TaxID=2053191 RepID=A0A917MNU8_9MICO|nr:L,D-transpeptidase family protein [Microbacterium album]GGH50737.1 peptidoglycan-binding protein [Microbacterium album]
MTDVATKPENVIDGGDDTATTAVALGDGAPGDPPRLEWAPAEPKPRKKRLALWLGIPGGLVLAGAVVASLVLIAPGTAVAGTPVGGMTPGMAAEAVTQRLATTEFTIGDATLTGEQLGLSVDAQAAAGDAFETAPMWKLSEWGPTHIEAPVTLDAERAAEALRQALPDLYTDYTNARVVFDGEAGRFTVEPSAPGQGVDVNALAAELTTALAAGGTSVEPTLTEVEAPATTQDAEAFAAQLNDQADTAGFYLEDVRAHGVDLPTVASWMDISSDPVTGDFIVTADEQAIAEAIKDLPEKVNQDVIDARVVTNSAGDHLRTIQEGQDGFGISSTDGVAEEVTASLAAGDLRFELQGEVVKHNVIELFRRVEVDKSAGMTYLYEGPEPGQEKLVASYPVALGTGGQYETQTGHFTVYGQLTIQHMGSCDSQGRFVPGGRFDYCTANVPWVTYFNGDQGFHGTYWHNNFGPGARMSHGCVNMTNAAAEHMYRFAQVGTEVWVHD